MLHNSEEVSSALGVYYTFTIITTRQSDAPYVPLIRPLSTKFSNSSAYVGFSTMQVQGIRAVLGDKSTVMAMTIKPPCGEFVQIPWAEDTPDTIPSKTIYSK